MRTYPHVFEPVGSFREDVPFEMRGCWNSSFFHNDGPIVLELGCGQGEYTVGLAGLFPDKNFIGVDIKGDRLGLGTDLFSQTPTLCEQLGQQEFMDKLEQSSKYYDTQFY